MEISVLIVDDSIPNALAIASAVESYNERSTSGFTFTVAEVCKGNLAYIEGKGFLAALSQSVDILLIDYNLTTGLGTDLFQSIPKPYTPYRILHSETDDNFKKAFQRNKLYDVMAKSKEPEDIHSALEVYETTILKVKRTGNTIFKILKERQEEDKKFAGVKLENIFYAKSIGKNYVEIYFRNADQYEIGYASRSTQSLTYFVSSGYPFVFLTNLIAINLLLVAKIDLLESVVRFITLESKNFELPFEPDDLRRNEIDLIIPTIEGSLPDFFTK